jgi:peptidylprolyl isomerase
MKTPRISVAIPIVLLALGLTVPSCRGLGQKAESPAKPAAPTSAGAAPSPQAAAVTPPSTAAATAKTAEERVVVTLNGGRVVIQLFAEDAPAHCENFKRLVRSGYYNGVGFQVVCFGFAQTGERTGAGREGIPPSIPAEIKRPHVRGAVAAARRGDARNPRRESHGSEFLIMKVTHPAFDGQYTVFGQVVEGMEAIDRIQEGDKDSTEGPYAIKAAESEKIIKAEVVPGPSR